MKGLLSTLFIFLFSTVLMGQSLTIVLNPGHGGKDPGNLKSSKKYLNEKDLNLIIAEKVAKYLSENIPNLNVLLTRTDDRFLSLDETVAFANTHHADYFISIHCNANNNSNVRGISVHIHNENTRSSKLLAQNIEKDLRTRAQRKSRGVKNKNDRHHNLQVLWQTNMPAVLVECGFMSNPTEEKYLNSSYGQDILASSIYRGIKNFILDLYPNRKLEPYYVIRLSSSKKRLPTNTYQFKKVGHSISEKDLGADTSFRYIYFAGKFDTKEAAKKALLKIKRSTGFKDAFIVKEDV